MGDRLDMAIARAGPLRRAGIDDRPFALGDDLEHGLIGLDRRRIGQVRLNVRIARALLFRGVEAGIGDRVRVPRTKPRDHLEPRRVDRISRDVVDRRQPVGLHAEIERISDERDPDEQRGDGLAHPADALPPDDDASAEGQQDRDHGERQSAREGGKSRHDIECARTHDDDGNESRRERKQRDPPRPKGKP